MLRRGRLSRRPPDAVDFRGGRSSWGGTPASTKGSHMLGRKTFTQEELDSARSSIERELRAYKKLKAGADAQAAEAFEPLFCNAMILRLDRPFVHRVRMVTGKDPNALNEVELLVDSLMAGDGVLDVGTVIKWKPDETVLGLEAGGPISLSLSQFERLAETFFAELE